MVRTLIINIIFATLMLVNSGCMQQMKKKTNKSAGAQLNESVTLSYSHTTFTEAPSNIGYIENSILLTLSGGSFVSNLSNQFSVSNLPTGLTASLSRLNNRQARLSLVGTSTDHSLGQSRNISFSLSPQAVTGFLQPASASVLGVNQTFRLDFQDPAKLSYSGMSFLENTLNMGQVSQTRTITLTGDQFASSLFGKYTISNVPAGLIATITRDSATQLTVGFIGTAAAHETADSIVNMTITFDDSAFVYNASAANVIGYHTPNLAVNFYSTANIQYSRNVFFESQNNDGSFSDTSIIDLAGDTFAASLAGLYTISNLPTGLTGSISRISDTEALLMISGNAVAHTAVDSVANVTVEFLNGAFSNIATSSSVSGYLKNDITLSYFSNPALSYSGNVYTESLNNDGSIEGTTQIYVSNDRFVQDIAGTYSITNLPSGLNARLTRVHDQMVELSFYGNADNHIASNSIANLTITFTANAFENTTNILSMTNYQKNDFLITFFSYPSLTYSLSTFGEAVGNDGSTTDQSIITLNNDKFAADLTGTYTVTGYPSGLTPVLTRDSDTQATLTFTGNATAHEASDTRTNITLTFNSQAFEYSNNVTYVANYSKNDFQMVFLGAAALSYSRSSFAENALNNGTVTETSVITLSNDTFVADITGRYLITNVPIGLTAVLTRDSATQLTLSFSGAATLHSLGNSVSNIRLSFTADAFTNATNANSVLNYDKSDLAIVFTNPAGLTINRIAFNENALNNGTVTETSTITLTGDTFAASIAGTYTFTNVPTGLTPVLTRDSATQLTLSWGGAAVSHYVTNNVANVQLTFLDAAFVASNAVNVTNYQTSNISFTFIDPQFANDPLVAYAWHLQNTGQSNFAVSPGVATQDIRLPPQTIDLSGETGNGISVAVSDTGVEISHEDLAANNDGASNRNYNNIPSNWISAPTPVDPHGTMVTGIVASIAGNNLGSRGVAPEVDFAGFTFVGINNPSLAIDLNQLTGTFDIFNFSYGYEQCQGAILDPSFIAQLETGAKTYRAGRGTNYVKSSGNSFISSLQQSCPGLWNAGLGNYLYAGNANLANDMAYPWQIVVGAVNARGLRSSYSSPGANLWVSAPGGEFGQNDPALMTTDQTGCNAGIAAFQAGNPINNFEAGNNLVLNPDCKYTTVMNGTSSAAPVTSGVVALMLEANPNLGFRDVKKILADTARKIDPTAVNLNNPLGFNVPAGHVYDPGWTTNGAGYEFHNWYGFGMVHAGDAVAQAQATVTYLPAQQEAEYASGVINVPIPDNSAAGGTNTINVASALTVEHIQIRPNITHQYMSEIGVEITSPSGTRSVLLYVNANTAQTNWNAELMSNAFYGETATGNWTIKVIDGAAADTGVLVDWDLKIYGY